MIQRYFKLPASADDIVREIFAFDTWTEWWPGVQQVKVLQADPERPLVHLTVKTVATIQMTMQFERGPNAIQFRQVKGWFKKYYGDYTFLPTPDGSGTTVKITIDLESGMMVPKSIVYAKLAATLGELEQALAKRVREHAPRSTAVPKPGAGASLAAPGFAHRDTDAAAQTPARKLAQIFATPTGVEVWIAGRPYRLEAVS
jgi:hypothetical protein